jgi:hypothetical protein
MFEQPDIGSRWRHLKRGTTYRVEGMCIIEATMLAGVIYTAEADGTMWVRPVVEFMDGRFEREPR